ncbi:MAG: tRNA epoxyqueuosine(34) reductase QueG [Actinobacteria bacterium]|nr:tRNA epoxyqueuosine(34) reductase QueG [Actinomycetota bacterium]
MAEVDIRSLADEVCRLGRAAGLTAVGIAPAAPFEDTRRVLEERRRDGLHGGMQFTYRNPARSTDPGRTVAGAQALVVGAWDYRRAAPADATEQGEVARYAWRDHYADLRDALEQIAVHLRAAGWTARVVVDDNALVDREAAYRAGLGWYGKNTNLLLDGQGSWFVLGSVVTDAPLPETGPPRADGCGPCSRCLSACPTGALVAPGVLDARRCLAWLLQVTGPFPREYREALGGRVYGCDDCQEVCPPNRALDRVDPAPPAEADAQAHVDLLALLSLDDASLMRDVGRWYVPRREARYVRRNALVALGNVGNGRDPAVVDALRRCLADDDAIVRGHAVWAAAQLGRHDLLATLVDEDDPDVRAELAAVGR